MSFEVHPLNEGYYTIGFDKVFHEFNPDIDDLKARPKGSLLVEIQPFLIKTPNDIILLDTGLGFHLRTGPLKIYENLRQHGVEPEDVNMVLVSHLHKDHAGALNFLNAEGESQVSFPNATYYVSEDEYNYGIEKGATSYIVQDFGFLKNYSAVSWLGKEGKVNDYISYKQDGGHCKHHTSFTIRGEGETYFFGGDNAPQQNQMLVRYIAKYDYDGETAMALRKAYSEQGIKEHWYFLFYHDLKNPVYQLKA